MKGKVRFSKTYDVAEIFEKWCKDLTKNEMEIACIGSSSSQFMRVEDVDYQKVLITVEMCFFAVTG
jgi:hypothetical protein